MTGPKTPRGSPGLSEKHDDGRLVAPSASRNIIPILDALKPLLTGRSGTMLEIGCGTGQHAAAFAAAFPDLNWQPSDPFEPHRTSTQAWVRHAALKNLCDPVDFDATQSWDAHAPLVATMAANVIHISPWSVAEGIIRGASTALEPGGLLIFYGPFKEAGQHTGDGNAAFDQSLRARDPEWGIRDLDDVAGLASNNGFSDAAVTTMPANNRLVVFRRN